MAEEPQVRRLRTHVANPGSARQVDRTLKLTKEQRQQLAALRKEAK